jgi:4a-hydroxytetrahydrobiopterin dehydratase
VERRKLETGEINGELMDLGGDWDVNEKGELHKRFKFANFAEALAFVNKVAEIAERRDHHPDILFGWGFAEFSLITHDRGGLTDFDFAVAKEIDAI